MVSALLFLLRPLTLLVRPLALLIGPLLFLVSALPFLLRPLAFLVGQLLGCGYEFACWCQPPQPVFVDGQIEFGCW